MRVPRWRDGHAASLVASTSLLSRALGDTPEALADAERILDGSLRLFGRQIVVPNGLPDWHRDYFSGTPFAVKPHPAYVIRENSGADIVVVWELSRLQFVPTLVQAYRESGDRRYSDHFYQVLDHWSVANPYRQGVNWTCGLDIAIRACNIALGLVFFEAGHAAPPDSARRLLWAHLQFLQHHDLHEARGTVNNHVLVAAVLQLALLELFEGGEVEQWKSAARAIVESEVSRQFHTDGGNFESALMYHQFVLESMFVAVAFIAGRDDVRATMATLPSGFGSCLQRATAFIADVTLAWGATPHVGDSSDGRILIHRDYFDWTASDPSYLVDWSRHVFGEADPFSAATEHMGLRVHAASGLGLYRGLRYAAIGCAMPVQRVAGGHNHMDKASLLLRIGACPVLVDSGTFCYTPDLAARARFRHGYAHNVVLLDGQDQAALPGPGAFEVPAFDDVGAEQLAGDPPALRMWHNGNAHRKERGLIQRIVYFENDGLRVNDEIEGQGNAQAEIVFNVATGLQANALDEGVQIFAADVALCTILRPGSSWQLVILPSEVSPAYGERQPATRVVFTSTVDLPARFTSRIVLAGQIA
jgi:hypothetical protein